MFRLFAVIFLAAPFLAGKVAIAQEISWDRAILAVEQKQDQYCEYARKVDGTCFAGTMYNGHRSDEHTCSIVARRLGLEQHRDRLEGMLVYPPLDGTTSGHDAAIFASTLDSWIVAATQLKNKQESYLVSVWNLDCVGRLGIPPSDYIANNAPDAEFEIEGNRLLVYGDIEYGFAKRFSAVLENAPDIREIALGSGGGSVQDAIISGLIIRQRNLDTTIFGNCFSACPLVFAGGVNRVLWASSDRLGFHQVSQNGKAISHSDPAYQLVYDYLAEMGVDPQIVITWMLATPPSRIHEPKPIEICPSNLATFIQRIC